MAELWSGFLQLNHFPRDNTIDLCVKGNALVHSQDARLGYSDSPSHCKPQSCCHLCAPKQQLTRAGKSSAWGFLSSAETHFLLSKCWFNTRGTAFANCKILSFKKDSYIPLNSRYLCWVFLSPYSIISRPHLAKFDLIPALHLKGFSRHMSYNRAAIY